MSSIEPADFRVFAPEQRRGKYEAAEVDDLLAYLAEQYRAVWDERAELVARLAAIESELTAAREELLRFRDREQHLAQALLHAEAIAAEVRKKAERERQEIIDEARTMADALLDEAEGRAQEIVGQTRSERDRLEHEISELTDRRRELKGQYRDLLVSALELVDEDEAGKAEGTTDPPKTAGRARV